MVTHKLLTSSRFLILLSLLHTLKAISYPSLVRGGRDDSPHLARFEPRHANRNPATGRWFALLSHLNSYDIFPDPILGVIISPEEIKIHEKKQHRNRLDRPKKNHLNGVMFIYTASGHFSI